MKHISILVLKEAIPSSISDPHYMFNGINMFLAQQGKPALFEVDLVASESSISLAGGLFQVATTKTINQDFDTDLILIPALSGEMARAVEINSELIPWIKNKAAAGAEVASMCVGAFLLAATGLVDNQKCSTHWLFEDQFKEMYPDVEYVNGRIVTEKDGIYSSGGASSYWNLLLHLVEKYAGPELAIHAAKFFALDIGRTSQSHFVMFSGQKNHTDNDIRKIQEYVENNYREKISVEQICMEFGIGRRSLERRFKKATNNTVTEYIQRVKIEAAKKDFELTRKNINEVMYEVGYSDPKAFRDVFRKITGMSPLDYRTRYNRGTLNAA